MTKRKVQVWVYYRQPESLVYSFLILKTRPERAGGFWQPVTGGVHSNEGLAAAALRETREETGLELNENDHHPEVIEHSFEYENRGQVYQEHGFSIHLKHSPPPLKLDPKEHVEYQWVTAKEAFKTIAHPSNAAMLKILLTRLAKQ